MRTVMAIVYSAVMLAVVAGPARAQTYDSGSTGALGPFTLPNSLPNTNCQTSPNCVVTLPPNGELHYTTVTIPSPWVVKFAKNATSPANTPVVIRASGDVIIAGTIDVSGTAGANAVNPFTILASNAGLGGPGGFNGGAGANGIVSTTGGVGVGPGGGAPGFTAGGNGQSAGGAGFALVGMAATSGGAGGVAYGTASLLPIIGGSGGGGGGVAYFGASAGGGGGGGGALLIASSGTITLGASGATGTILAKGGNGGTESSGAGRGGGGSGGAVRLVATTITSTGSHGQINVSGGFGGVSGFAVGSRGRIRIEAYTNTAQINLNSAPASVGVLPKPVVLANSPTLRIAAVGGVATPTTPLASLGIPDVVLPATATNPVQVSLTASQVPLGTTILVSVKGQTGAGSSVVSTGLTGTVASSTATANVTLPTDQPSLISASATFELVASSGQGPVYAEGERVERVRVVASLGGQAQVMYITVSGQEIPATLPQ